MIARQGRQGLPSHPIDQQGNLLAEMAERALDLRGS